MKRYSNQLKVAPFDPIKQTKLLNSTVLVIGAGGLGCPVLQQLALLGVGKIILLDADHIEESNLNRQSLFGLNDIGKSKAQVAKRQVEALNEDCSVEAHCEFLTSKNAEKFCLSANVIVDCTDNLATRYTLDRQSQRLGIPLVFGGVRKWEGQVGVFNYLRGKSFEDIFPKEAHLESLEDCELLGTFGFVCQMVASYQCAEVLKILSGIGTVLSGQILTIDLMNNRSLLRK